LKNSSSDQKRKYRAIKLQILMHIAWKNLWAKKTRSILTVMGSVIGITAIYFLFSMGLGIQELVTQKIIGDKSLKAIDVSSANSKVIKLNEESINKFKSYPHVEKVGVQYSFPAAIEFKGGEVDSVVYGVNESYQQLMNLNLTSGRLLNAIDNKQIVINLSTLDALGLKDKAKEAIGKKIKINIPLTKVQAKQKEIKDEFAIVGVIDSKAGNEILMLDSLFGIAGVPYFQQAKVVADNKQNIGTLRKQIESNGFQTTSLIDTVDEVNRIFKFFQATLISLGSIGMIVSVLGMFNTLTISLLERTKEIGLMIALGGRQSDMRKLFVLEAFVISVAGALIGLFFALAGGQLINMFINNVAHRRGVQGNIDLFASPLWSVAGIVLFSIIVGLIVVYFPARRAERINPIDALRSE